MRPYALLPVALLLLAACGGGNSNRDENASPSPDASPAPLRSCEERQLNVDGAQVSVQANIDGTPAQIVVLHATNDDVRAKAYQDARKMFGDPHPDTRTQTKQFKWGMVQLSDMCGRPVMPNASPSGKPPP